VSAGGGGGGVVAGGVSDGRGVGDGEGVGVGDSEGFGDGDGLGGGDVDAGGLGLDGVPAVSAKCGVSEGWFSATGPDPLVVGKAASRASAPPHDPKNKRLDARIPTSSLPRCEANRMNDGLASNVAPAKKNSEKENRLAASLLPTSKATNAAAKLIRNANPTKPAVIAANRLPTLSRFGSSKEVRGSRGIHRVPFHLQRPSAEMAGCHCFPSQ
jgi:hypothetical protein